MEVICLTISDGLWRSITLLWILIWNSSQVLEPSPQGVFLVVILKTLVGIRTGPFTFRSLSLAPLIRSPGVQLVEGNEGVCPSSCPLSNESTSCTPGTSYTVDCNTCVCDSNGTPVCSTNTCSTSTTTSSPSTSTSTSIVTTVTTTTTSTTTPTTTTTTVTTT